MGEVPRRPLYSRYRRKSGSNSDIVKPTRMVESRCGAVALGRTYLLPPLSSGGALMVPPWLRFHIPLIGRVEGWRAGRPLDRATFSSPLHVARGMRISRTARPHLLHATAYGTYPAGATFGPSRPSSVVQ